MHQPVLLHEVIEALDPQPGQFFIDGTLGSGGHARAIMERIKPGGTLLAIDWDASAVEQFIAPSVADGVTVIALAESYTNLPKLLQVRKLGKGDGLLLDLGVSSSQLDEVSRGFSFLRDGPLDMRYATGAGSTAREFVNHLDAQALAKLFTTCGEERYARTIARAIISAREVKPIESTGALAAVIQRAVPHRFGRGRIHPATRVFQALRIAVNRELDNVRTVLDHLSSIMKSNGRVAVITYHSLEDRLVKQRFRSMALANQATLVTKKPVRPTRNEVLANRRSRSAKLRSIMLR